LAKDLATVLFPAPEGPSIAMVSFFLLKVFAIPTPQKGRNGLPYQEGIFKEGGEKGFVIKSNPKLSATAWQTTLPSIKLRPFPNAPFSSIAFSKPLSAI
jgi:hypothetical protein